MKRSYEANNFCDIDGILYIPSAVPDIVENIINPSILPPTKLFDDLYFVGSTFVGTIILKTEEGLVLIDSMNTASDGENIIFPGIISLGLDPMDIKKIIITHGHVDHYGAAKYIKEKTNCTVYMTKIDHNFMREVIVPLGEDSIIQGEADDPGVDVYVNDGDIIKSGSYEIRVVFTPGHTPGGISLILPVHNEDAKHTVGIWGGTKIPEDLSSIEQYLGSIEHFIDECKKYNADVSVQTHPFVDYNLDKGIFDGTGKHPSIILGEDRFQLFLQCIKAYAVGSLEQFKLKK
ncbi:N-acyl homoserine lactonase AttM [Clostridiales bacterium]|nr:N-acyl homoserine lactonase AttM [Clostridiales bacterium]